MPPTRINEVVFLSQTWAEAYLPRPYEAIISITDYGKPEANLNEGWTDCFRISFDDVDPIESPLEPGENLIEIQEHQATEIARFVHRIADKATVLVVHCRYGQSRSAGIAKAVAEFYGLQFPAEYDYANNYIYNLVITKLRQEKEA